VRFVYDKNIATGIKENPPKETPAK
jgi:hypothetical protein